MHGVGIKYKQWKKAKTSTARKKQLLKMKSNGGQKSMLGENTVFTCFTRSPPSRCPSPLRLLLGLLPEWAQGRFWRPGLDGSRHGTAGLARKARAGPAHSDCCQEPLAHLLQERHLQPLNELSAAHASVHGAFGRIKIRRVIHKLRGLRAENSERCHPPG